MSIELNRRVGALERLVNRLTSQGGAAGGVVNISARVYNDANISINDITETAVTFNTESYDDATFHSTSVNTSRFTIPFDGAYFMLGQVKWEGVNVGRRHLYIDVSATTRIAANMILATSADERHMQVSAVYQLTAGQYVELIAYHNRGSALNLLADGVIGIAFSIARIR